MSPGRFSVGFVVSCTVTSKVVDVSLPAESSAVQVTTDHPTAACMASQYAGWQITGEKYFAMGSGPMRAAAGREELFEKIPGREQSDAAVGVLETSQIPPAEVCRDKSLGVGQCVQGSPLGVRL